MGREAFLAEVRRSLPGTLDEEGSQAMLLPRSAHEVAVALQLAHRLEGPLAVPGNEPLEGEIPLDLRRLSSIIAVDEVSRLAHVQGGMPVDDLDEALAERGMGLGLVGPAPEAAVGEWLGRGAPGARQHDDDPVDQLVAGLELVLPDGRALSIRPAPRRAVGPDLVSAAVGARGRIGTIVGAHLVIRPRAPHHERAFLFEQDGAAEAARAWIRGRGVRPVATRVVQVAEGPVLSLRIEGEGPLTDASLEVADRTAREHGGVPFPPEDLPPPEPSAARPVAPIIDRLAERLR